VVCLAIGNATNAATAVLLLQQADTIKLSSFSKTWRLV
jgi:hypothetical protein